MKLTRKAIYSLFVILIIIISIIFFYNKTTEFKTENLNVMEVDNSGVTKVNKHPIDKSEVITIDEDLDGDPIKETLIIEFIKEDENIGYGEKLNIKIVKDNKEFSHEESSLSHVIAEVHLLKINDENIYFYINSQGISDNPTSIVYKFANNKIEKVLCTSGYIENFDENGLIKTRYSFINNNEDKILTYYSINKGSLIFNNKKNLIGEKIKFPFKVTLFSNYKGEDLALKSYVNDDYNINNLIELYGKENIVYIADKNEELMITDIDYTVGGNFKEGTNRNIPIKVKNSEGKEGWVLWLNGGD